jgi:hypothetical protein
VSNDRYRKHLSGGMAIADAPTMTRDRRCQNCRHWNNDELATRHYKTRRFNDMQAEAARVLEQGGMPKARITAALEAMPGIDAEINNVTLSEHNQRRIGQNYEYGDSLIREGMLGLCLVGKSPGDFCHAHYLCAGWDARVRPDGALEGNTDELPAEARERLGLDKAPTK